MLIHWNNPKVPLSDSIASLCNAKKKRQARHVGVANFTTAMLDEAVKLSSEPLVTNQIGDVRLWDAADGREIEKKEASETGESYLFPTDDGFFTPARIGERWVIRWWPYNESGFRVIGSTEPGSRTTVDRGFDIDRAGRRFAWRYGRRLRSVKAVTPQSLYRSKIL